MIETTNTGPAQTAAVDKIRFREKMAFALGGGNAAMLSFIIATYLMFFYTDVFGMPVAIFGILMLTGRIWDAVNDVLFGAIVDNTVTRWGRIRPYFLWFAIPTGITFALMYQVPDWSMTAKIVYAFVAYFLYDTFYTFVLMANGGMLAVTTREPMIRTTLNFFTATGSSIVNLAIPLLFWPAVMLLGGGGEMAYKTGFPRVAWIFGGIAALIYLYQFFFIRERYPLKKEQSPSLWQGIKYTMTNKYYLLITLIAFCGNTALFFITSVLAYYSKLVVNDMNFVMVIMMIYAISTLICFPIFSFLAKKIPVRNLYIFTLIVAVLCSAARLIFGIDNVTMMMVITGFMGIAGAGMWFPAVYIADAIEYSEWKTGKVVIGIMNSVGSFMQKMAMALVSAALAWMLAWAGYTDESPLTEPIRTIISASMTTIPLVLGLIGLVLFLLFFDIDKHMPKVRAELAERREAKNDETKEEGTETENDGTVHAAVEQ
jgi:GPH family glycoside/pentoside/hexuronide:cation symporter